MNNLDKHDVSNTEIAEEYADFLEHYIRQMRVLEYPPKLVAKCCAIITEALLHAEYIENWEFKGCIYPENEQAQS